MLLKPGSSLWPSRIMKRYQIPVVFGVVSEPDMADFMDDDVGKDLWRGKGQQPVKIHVIFRPEASPAGLHGLDSNLSRLESLEWAEAIDQQRHLRAHPDRYPTIKRMPNLNGLLFRGSSWKMDLKGAIKTPMERSSHPFNDDQFGGNALKRYKSAPRQRETGWLKATGSPSDVFELLISPHPVAIKKMSGFRLPDMSRQNQFHPFWPHDESQGSCPLTLPEPKIKIPIADQSGSR